MTDYETAALELQRRRVEALERDNAQREMMLARCLELGESLRKQVAPKLCETCAAPACSNCGKPLEGSS